MHISRHELIVRALVIIFFLTIFFFFDISTCPAGNTKVYIQKKITINEFIILPKLSIKTNRATVSLLLDNWTKEKIKIRINLRLPQIARGELEKNEFEIEPMHFQIINYQLTFSSSFSGHLPSELITVSTNTGTENQKIKEISVNISKQNMPWSVFIQALLSQLVIILLVTRGICHLLENGGFVDSDNIHYWLIATFMVFTSAVIIYDIVGIWC